MGVNVFLVEDDRGMRSAVKEFLETAGHHVVMEAGTREEAFSLMQSGKLIELGVAVALVDGNLDEYVTGCRDGFEIAKAIRNLGVPITIIALSAARSDAAGYGDVYISKTGGPMQLLSAVEAAAVR